MNTITDVLSGLATFCAVEADCRDVLPALQELSVDVCAGDPPFLPRVHAGQARMVDGGASRGGGVASADLGFGHLTEDLRSFVAREIARTTKRWTLLKSDMEGTQDWRLALEAASLRWVRTGFWDKIGAQPQFSGDRPAAPGEGIAIAHAAGERLRWNGGGKHAIWRYPVVRGAERVHPTQTPVEMWEEIVADFTDPGELIGDWFCGSGALGVAVVRLNLQNPMLPPRRYIGVDRGCNWEVVRPEGEKQACPRCASGDGPHLGKPWAEIASEWIAAEAHGISTAERVTRAAGQLPMF